MSEMRNLLAIGEDKLEAVNRFLTARDNPLTDPLFAVIDKFGGPESINEQALAAGDPANLRDRLKEIDSPYLADLDWLAEQIDRKSFVDFADWCDARGVDPQQLNHQNAVTLEISALQFFPWLIA